MTQRTHDLAAVTLVTYRFLAFPPSPMNWITLVGVGVAAVLGAAVPDIDNVSSPAWHNRLLPWEGKATRHFLEGHRHVSHSLIGMFLFYFVFRYVLTVVPLSGLDPRPVSEAFMLGILSHIISDSLTEQGVPWVYPIPIKMGFPPFAPMRIKTGKWFEKLVVFPTLLLLLVAVCYYYRDNFRSLFAL